MDKLKVAVIGVGHLGKEHARVYNSLPGVDLVVVCDPDEERGRAVAEKHDVQWVPDVDRLPDKLGAVSIVTPTTSHFAMASAFLKRGIPCLVEKPMTATLSEAHALEELADEMGTTVQVGHIERFNPAVRALAEFGVDPRFIEVHRLGPFTFRSADISVVMDLMIHDIDIVLALAKSEVARVDACGVAVIGKLVDLANARLVFKSGCVVNMTASRIAVKRMRKIRVFSEDCYISLDYGAKEGYVYKKSPKLRLDSFNIESMHAKDILDLRGAVMGKEELLTIRKLPIDTYEPLQKEIESFIDCVRTNGTPVVGVKEGRRAIEVADLITSSIEQHDWFGVKDECL